MPKPKAGYPRKTKYPGITEIAPSLFRVRTWAVDPKTGKGAESNKHVHGTAEDALRVKMETRDAMRRGPEAARARVRLRDYAISWIERNARRGRRWSTRRSQATILDLHVLPYLGDYFVDAITRSDVEAWLDRMAERTDNPRRQGEGEDGRYDAPTIDLWLQKLRAVVAAYYLEFQIGPSPLLGIERPKFERVEPKRENSLTADQAAALLAHCEATRPQWYALLLVALTTGMRIGELTALRWEDVNEAEGTITVRRAQVCGREAGTKTRKIRVVPLSPDVAAVLRWHRARIDAETRGPVLVPEMTCARPGCDRPFEVRVRRGMPPGDIESGICAHCMQLGQTAMRREGKPTTRDVVVPWLLALPKRPTRRVAARDPNTPKDLVFPSTTGTFQNPNGIWNALKRMCDDELKIPRISPHGTRHTFNDLLRRAGVDSILRRAIVGHADEATNAIYTTIRNGDGAEEIGALVRRLKRDE